MPIENSGPYAGVDLARVMYGERARHVPAWMYVQHAGDGTVSFVGGSQVDTVAHPLRYGSERTHQLIAGEIIVRPHLIVATDALRGRGLGGLATDVPTPGEMLAGDLGEVLFNLGRTNSFRV